MVYIYLIYSYTVIVIITLQESVSVLHGTHEERMGSMESEATKLHQERDMARNAMEELKLQCAEV